MIVTDVLVCEGGEIGKLLEESGGLWEGLVVCIEVLCRDDDVWGWLLCQMACLSVRGFGIKRIPSEIEGRFVFFVSLCDGQGSVSR